MTNITNFYKNVPNSKKEEFQNLMNSGVWTNVFDYLQDSTIDLVCKKWKGFNDIIKEKELTKASQNYLMKPIFPKKSKEIKDKNLKEKIQILNDIPKKTFSGLKRISILYYDQLNKKYGTNSISYKKMLEANKKINLVIQKLIRAVFTPMKDVSLLQLITGIFKKNEIHNKLGILDIDIKITSWDMFKNAGKAIKLLKNLKEDDAYKLLSQNNIIWMENQIINEKKEINLASICELLQRISQ
ncbi:MAG: hypothetical protein AMS24_02285 [Chlamydiae bacterium SM23_39]|nr:MAG: hypothetical protein AMS24_02285 [Chlamydiae bacterium SM23_39]